MTNYKAKKKILKFLIDLKSNRKPNNQYNNIQLYYALIENGILIKKDRFELLIKRLKKEELIERGLSKLSETYIVSDKGVLYYSSSSWSRLNTNQKISIIMTILGIMAASCTAIFVTLYNCCPK